MIVHASTVHTDPHNASSHAHLFRPADDKTYPGVVMIQEWWGCEPHIRDVAGRLAREGFVVLVPDLFHGQITNEPDEAGKLMMATVESMERAIHEVELALDYLRNNAGVEPKKLGLMGLCMGGLLAYKIAERYPHLGAVSPWYGVMYDPKPEEAAKITAPLLGFYGENDGFIPVEQARKVVQTFKDAGNDAEFHIYPNAGHAFLNPDHGDYVEGAAKDAWSRAVAFFKDKLR